MGKALPGPGVAWIKIVSCVYWVQARNKRAERWPLYHDILKECFLQIASLALQNGERRSLRRAELADHQLRCRRETAFLSSSLRPQLRCPAVTSQAVSFPLHGGLLEAGPRVQSRDVTRHLCIGCHRTSKQKLEEIGITLTFPLLLKVRCNLVSTKRLHW